MESTFRDCGQEKNSNFLNSIEKSKLPSRLLVIFTSVFSILFCLTVETLLVLSLLMAIPLGLATSLVLKSIGKKEIGNPFFAFGGIIISFMTEFYYAVSELMSSLGNIPTAVRGILDDFDSVDF